MIAPRPKVKLPPTNWRPRPPTTAEKLQITTRQGGRCAVTGVKLSTLSETRFDHRPPIHEREWDEQKQDTIPPSRSVEHIRAVHVAPDRKITAADNSRMSRIDRLRQTTEAHNAALEMKSAGVRVPKKGTIPSRGFPQKTRRS